MANRTCIIEECNKPYQARGYCSKHYKEWWLANNPGKTANPKHEMQCANCGKTVYKCKSGTRKPVCSYECRYEVTYGRSHEEMVLDKSRHKQIVPYQRTWITILQDTSKGTPEQSDKLRFIAGSCGWCGENFVQDLRVTGMHAKYCSRKCSRKMTRLRYKLRYPDRRRGGYSSKIVPEKIRLVIYERDNWTCQLCGEPTARTYTPDDYMSPTLDHIIPQSTQLIPDHSENNLQLAHMICNATRGDKLIVF